MEEPQNNSKPISKKCSVKETAFLWKEENNQFLSIGSKMIKKKSLKLEEDLQRAVTCSISNKCSKRRKRLEGYETWKSLQHGSFLVKRHLGRILLCWPQRVLFLFSYLSLSWEVYKELEQKSLTSMIGMVAGSGFSNWGEDFQLIEI